MNELLPIELPRLAASYLFLALLLIMSYLLKLGRGKEFIAASVRMTLQLVIAGYLLELLFRQQHVLVSLAILVFMQSFASITVFGRVKGKMGKRLKKVVVAALFVGTTLPLAYFMIVVIDAVPWYEPRYFIPIAGMTVGNSMTGITLGVERMAHIFRNNHPAIEESLMLGATPQQAVKDYVSEVFSAAIIPTVNSMLGMGIIFLPGMMTGQILAGASPLSAIKYQIVIMMGIIGSVSLTVYLIVEFGYRTYFNERAQLVSFRD
ncbi:MAG TPA: iron export ABC transporter permease subunit FetB [Candidatus Limnocylindrales bacterium]|nr:iron export ABC transporter permease subunit FetB [Candidatus Limnocylindrales bacterium]